VTDRKRQRSTAEPVAPREFHCQFPKFDGNPHSRLANSPPLCEPSPPAAVPRLAPTPRFIAQHSQIREHPRVNASEPPPSRHTGLPHDTAAIPVATLFLQTLYDICLAMSLADSQLPMVCTNNQQPPFFKKTRKPTIDAQKSSPCCLYLQGFLSCHVTTNQCPNCRLVVVKRFRNYARNGLRAAPSRRFAASFRA
jgi:hypothetical protein